MNRKQDFDHTLRQWLDEGADQAPERFVWAALEDVERTAQRGAWRASLEGILMKLKPATPFLGVAAAVLLAIAAYSLFGGNVGGPTTPTPIPIPIPRVFTTADLPTIILTAANAPDGLTVDATTTGYEALNTPLRSGTAIMNLTGFTDARMTNLNSTEAGGYVTWSALYETTAEAEAAFDFLLAEHESAAGWGLKRSPAAPLLGDQSVMYDGAAYTFDDARIHLWRVNNLLLAAVALDVVAVDSEMAARVDEIANGMDERAR